MARILIIQSQDSRNEPLLQCLRELHEYVIVIGIDDANEALKKESFDVIISNVFLSGWNVFEFLREMKSHPTLQEIPVIYFCSKRGRIANVAQSAMKAALRELGAFGYLAVEDYYTGDKFSKIEMQNCLESLINDRRETSSLSQ